MVGIPIDTAVIVETLLFRIETNDETDASWVAFVMNGTAGAVC